MSSAAIACAPARRQGFARNARRLWLPFTAAVAAARQLIMQSRGRLLRYAAIHDPKPSATAGAAAQAGPSSFSRASSTLSRNVCSAESCHNTSGPDGGSSSLYSRSRRRGHAATLRDRYRSCEGEPVELVEHGPMKALDDAVGLRAFDLGAGVIDVLHRQVEPVLVPLGGAGVLGPRSVRIRLSGTPCSSKNGTTRSLSRSAATSGVLRS